MPAIGFSPIACKGTNLICLLLKKFLPGKLAIQQINLSVGRCDIV